jgi:hypothetical protein
MSVAAVSMTSSARGRNSTACSGLNSFCAGFNSNTRHSFAMAMIFGMKGKCPMKTTFFPAASLSTSATASSGCSEFCSTSSSELMAASPMLASSGFSERAYSASSLAFLRCSNPASRMNSSPCGLVLSWVAARPQPRLQTRVECVLTITFRTAIFNGMDWISRSNIFIFKWAFKRKGGT